jgi:hypothetical protein
MKSPSMGRYHQVATLNFTSKMKNIIVSTSLLLLSLPGIGQIQYLRYSDDFSFLKADSIQKKGLQKMKYISLSDDVNVSFGGEIREQLQRYENINFGDVPPSHKSSNTWQIWHRIMAHVNLEVGKKARVFAQLSSTYRFLNINPLTQEIDQNELSLHQSFIEYHFNKKWTARIGRQEMSYGSHRLITFREGPNTRLTFDAAVLKYSSKQTKVDVLAISPIISKPGVFDDHSLKDLAVGIYANARLTKAVLLDYYLIYFHSKRRKYNFEAGKENREIVGFRLFSQQAKTNYEVEATYQVGKFNHLFINAYGISFDLNHKINFTKNLTFGVTGNYLSGDKNKNDNQLNTYNLLYSKPQYGLTAPLGATNMVSFNPYFKLNPTRKSNVYFGANLMWRQSTQDGTYSPGAVQLRPRPEILFTSTEKGLGTLLVLEINYAINSNFSIGGDASQFLAGNYVKQTGAGQNITYLSFKASFKF